MMQLKESPPDLDLVLSSFSLMLSIDAGQLHKSFTIACMPSHTIQFIACLDWSSDGWCS